MTSSKGPAFFIGWDVGAWNCDKNRKSRDAIVILDEHLALMGKWRGNLRHCIGLAGTTREWLQALFTACDAELPDRPVNITMAIDIPLGFSDEFVALITRRAWSGPDDEKGRNRYLFRHTERQLFGKDLKPLSAIKDMIGSQATKGMHVLSKFAPKLESCGVWTNGDGFRAIETYPTACREAPEVTSLLKGSETLGHQDINDARVCALIASLFATRREVLEEPDAATSLNEGWIWVPKQRR